MKSNITLKTFEDIIIEQLKAEVTTQKSLRLQENLARNIVSLM